VYGHADPRDATTAKSLTLDEARRVAANIAKLPTHYPQELGGPSKPRLNWEKACRVFSRTPSRRAVSASLGRRVLKRAGLIAPGV
jgi:hypothetical protein